MKKKQQRDFDTVAASWDEKPLRQALAEAVAQGIAADIPLSASMAALEYGCGTGLCGLRLAPAIGHLTAVDTSAGMLTELQKKLSALKLGNVTPRQISAERWELPEQAFDLIFASMVLHHIANTGELLERLKGSLKPGGFLALADLEPEDGSFHDDPSGVSHQGFDPQQLLIQLQQLGFVALKAHTVHRIPKQRDGEERPYPVFLLTGQLPGRE
ncbi:MAG: class I SAM-dependent methyltransferase [Desulfuromonadaceae bacterium]